MSEVISDRRKILIFTYCDKRGSIFSYNQRSVSKTLAININVRKTCRQQLLKFFPIQFMHMIFIMIIRNICVLSLIGRGNYEQTVGTEHPAKAIQHRIMVMQVLDSFKTHNHIKTILFKSGCRQISCTSLTIRKVRICVSPLSMLNSFTRDINPNDFPGNCGKMCRPVSLSARNIQYILPGTQSCN